MSDIDRSATTWGAGDYSISAVYPGVTGNQAGSYLLVDTWYAPVA
jgi:hypothetical protein